MTSLSTANAAEELQGLIDCSSAPRFPAWWGLTLYCLSRSIRTSRVLAGAALMPARGRDLPARCEFCDASPARSPNAPRERPTGPCRHQVTGQARAKHRLPAGLGTAWQGKGGRPGRRAAHSFIGRSLSKLPDRRPAWWPRSARRRGGAARLLAVTEVGSQKFCASLIWLSHWLACVDIRRLRCSGSLRPIGAASSVRYRRPARRGCIAGSRRCC